MLRSRLRIDDDLEYGYQWYLGRFPAGDGGGGSGGGRGHWAGAMGNGGQRLYVVPELDLVVAVTAGDYDAADQGAIPSTVMEHIVLPWAEHAAA